MGRDEVGETATGMGSRCDPLNLYASRGVSAIHTELAFNGLRRMRWDMDCRFCGNWHHDHRRPVVQAAPS